MRAGAGKPPAQQVRGVTSMVAISYRRPPVGHADRTDRDLHVYASAFFVDAFCMPLQGPRSGDGRYPSFCDARFSFLVNQRAAASFSIHSASSFTLSPYLAW